MPEGGWAKHFFYRMSPDDTAFIAFWEMHDVPGADKVETSLSKAAGVPDQINHIAFQATDREDLQRRCKEWQAAGLSVLEIDHNWCHSIYTKDPNGNLVEFAPPLAPCPPMTVPMRCRRWAPTTFLFPRTPPPSRYTSPSRRRLSPHRVH